MATNIVMPKMGYDMREGTVVRWHKKEGETVARGDVLADIETDKATVEFEAFTSGVLGKIVVDAGVLVPVGELIAVITAPGEELPLEVLADVSAAPAESPAAESSVPAPVSPTASAAAAPAAAGASSTPGEVRASPIARRIARERDINLAEVTGTGPGGRIVEKDVLDYQPGAAAPASSSTLGEVRASPIARRLARERDINLAEITGTGPGGRIVEKDVLDYQPGAAEPASGAAVATQRVELTRMRQAIARVTVGSKREAPHFYVTAEIDMTQAMKLRADFNETNAQGARVTVNDLIIKASAIALSRHPKFNASFISDGQGDALQMNSDVNIGIAIALDAGLMVPGIANCESKSLVEIAAASKDLIERANSGHLRNEEYSETTFSVSNLGMFDVESFAAIIYPPHAAVLAIGAVQEQPVVREGQVVVAQIMKATLSTDHRVADGAEAARFLMEIKSILEKPVTLLL